MGVHIMPATPQNAFAVGLMYVLLECLRRDMKNDPPANADDQSSHK